MNKLMVLAAGLLAASFAIAQDVEIVKVKGRGVGTDKTEALKDAYRDAVERAVGLYIDAEQMMENEELVKDQILTQSNAYIEKYDVAKETTKPNGLVEIQILADVRKTALTKKISDVMPTKTFRLSDGLKNEHAKITTVEKRNVDGAALLKKALEGFDPLALALDCSLASTESVVGTLSGKLGPAKGTIRVNYLFKAEINEARFFKNVSSRLTEVLEQISIDEPQDVTLSLQPRSKVDVNAMVEKARNVVSNAGNRNRFMMQEYDVSDKIKMPMQISRHDKERHVLVVTKGNKFKTVYLARLYRLDQASSKVYSDWEQSRRCTSSPKFSVSFLGGDGEPLCAETVQFGVRSSVDDWIGSVFAPWFSSYGAASAAYQWKEFDLPKNALPEIKDMKIEIAK